MDVGRSLGLAGVVLAAAMLNGACVDDTPACQCECRCNEGFDVLDADSQSECTDVCRDHCGGDTAEAAYVCYD